VDALEAGLGAEQLDPGGKALSRGADVVGQRAVVQRQHAAEAAPAQTAAKQREDRAVVDHAVHQQDRRAGRLDVADQQTALDRGELRQAAGWVDAGSLRQHSQGVERGVRRHPGHFHGGTAQTSR
jgi:hypothetical protein